MLNVRFRDNHVHLRNNIHLTEVDKLHFDNLLETDSHFAKITREKVDHYFYMKNASEYHPFGANRYIKQENTKPTFLGPFNFTGQVSEGQLKFDININDFENNDLSLSLKPGSVIPEPFNLVKIENNDYDIIGAPTTGIETTAFTLQLTDLKAPIEETGQREYVDQEFTIQIFGTPTVTTKTNAPIFRVFLGDSQTTIENNLRFDLDNYIDIQFNDGEIRTSNSEQLGDEIEVNLNNITSITTGTGKTFLYNITNNLGLQATLERDYFVIEQDIPTSTKTEMTDAVNNLVNVKFLTESGQNMLVADEIFENLPSLGDVLDSVDENTEPEKKFILQQKILEELFDNDSSIEAISIDAGSLDLHTTFPDIDEDTQVNIFSTRIENPVIIQKPSADTIIPPNIYIHENVGDDLELNYTSENGESIILKVIYLGINANGKKKYNIDTEPSNKLVDLNIIEVSTNDTIIQPKEFLENEKIFILGFSVYTF